MGPVGYVEWCVRLRPGLYKWGVKKVSFSGFLKRKGT